MLEQIDKARLELEIVDLIAVIAIACMGGIVKWGRMPYRGHHKALHFLMCLFTAGFVGMLAHFFMTWLEVDLSLQFAVSGAVGYSGGAMLDVLIPLLVKTFYRKTGLEMPETSDTDSEINHDSKN